MRYLLLLLVIPACAVSHAGTIRYDLPEFLGVHLYDAEAAVNPLPGVARSTVNTPFGMYEVELATIVLEGRWVAGRAHGDGIHLEATSFDLLPSVSALPNFARSSVFNVSSPPSQFRLVTNYADPFVPEITPLPNPDQGPFPGVSFEVTLGFGPALATDYPLRIGAGPVFVDRSYIIDEPMVLEIDKAYILLSGASIVPEPRHFSMLVATTLGLVLGWAARRNIGSSAGPSVYPILKE